MSKVKLIRVHSNNKSLSEVIIERRNETDYNVDYFITSNGTVHAKAKDYSGRVGNLDYDSYIEFLIRHGYEFYGA